MKTIVIYHASCSDGFCAAWLLHKVYPDAEYMPMQYGDPVPVIRERQLFIVDFSFPRDDLIELNTHNDLVVLDHHTTAQVNCEGLDFCTFDMDKCGAELTLGYVKDKYNIPIDNNVQTLVDYVGDRDLWKWKLPKSKEVNAAIRSYSFDFDVWDTFTINNLMSDGEAIERYRRGLIQNHVKHAQTVSFAGYTVQMVECTTMEVSSEIGHEICDGYPFGIIYSNKYDKRIRTYSLRSNGDGVDVSEIAKRFGGGGHKHAAGFSLPL